ncbi:hypothetical protein VZT92_025450 [Zoarces viviparus]|uniref:Uncharacterized protein n=1 Tax=Zoarces viviparus TaxID=48416 RepID=A0AAW1DXI8_ZOAVI
MVPVTNPNPNINSRSVINPPLLLGDPPLQAAAFQCLQSNMHTEEEEEEDRKLSVSHPFLPPVPPALLMPSGHACLPWLLSLQGKQSPGSGVLGKGGCANKQSMSEDSLCSPEAPLQHVMKKNVGRLF